MAVRDGVRFDRHVRCHLVVALALLASMIVSGLNVPSMPAQGFDKYYEVTWGNDGHVKFGSGGTVAQLTLDQANASSFASKGKYLFGYISTGIQLVPGDSAGTVTAYYMSSDTANRDELDFEFLGNSSGEPYILQTNIFANGIGRREQRIYLWFDPTKAMHSYSVLWNKNQITFYVDEYPIRYFVNKESQGIAFPTSQPMTIYASIWDGDSWATQGGYVKLNWTHAPFVSTFGSFAIQACESATTGNCAADNGWWAGAEYQTLSQTDMTKLKWVQQNYMVYDYCTDTTRYSKPPIDCLP